MTIVENSYFKNYLSHMIKRCYYFIVLSVGSFVVLDGVRLMYSVLLMSFCWSFKKKNLSV